VLGTRSTQTQYGRPYVQYHGVLVQYLYLLEYQYVLAGLEYRYGVFPNVLPGRGATVHTGRSRLHTHTHTRAVSLLGAVLGWCWHRGFSYCAFCNRSPGTILVPAAAFVEALPRSYD
jgi:hypothetical protein